MKRARPNEWRHKGLLLGHDANRCFCSPFNLFFHLMMLGAAHIGYCQGIWVNFIHFHESNHLMLISPALLELVCAAQSKVRSHIRQGVKISGVAHSPALRAASAL